MSYYLISGLSGTGKSTVAEILNRYGYSAIDSDSYIGLSCWVDRKLGLPVVDLPSYPY